jgi:hypothetical protein
MTSTERTNARHRRYNRSAKGLARYKKYASTEKAKRKRYFQQRSRRTTQRLHETAGINFAVEHENRKHWGNCAHCRCKPKTGYNYCKWCREAWDFAEATRKRLPKLRIVNGRFSHAA